MKKQNKDISLSVVLPAYNDEFTIKDVVISVLKYIKPVVKNIEIIIVEDGSLDNTPLICDELSSRYPEVSTIHHKNNAGYGKTLRDGFNTAKGELIFYTDGDNQYDIEDFHKALNIFNEAAIDALVGFRFPRKDGLMRILISKIYNLLCRALFCLNVKDVNCSFKLIKREVIKNLYLDSESAFIDAEIIWKLKNGGYGIKELAVTNFPNKFRRSNFINPKLTLEMLYEMLKKRFSL